MGLEFKFKFKRNLFLGIDYAIILPTAWGYINTFMQFHYGGFVMGLLLSVFALSGAISGLILGYLNDTGFALKRLVLICIAFKIVGNVLYFIGINIYVVVISRLIAGVGMGMVVRMKNVVVFLD
jgi:predicted MFS family arabinose efflux permease